MQAGETDRDYKIISVGLIIYSSKLSLTTTISGPPPHPPPSFSGQEPFCYGSINSPFPGRCCFLRNQEILTGLNMAQTLALYPVTLKLRSRDLADRLSITTAAGDRATCAPRKTELLFSRAGEEDHKQY
jgi:hypothetical protein